MSLTGVPPHRWSAPVLRVRSRGSRSGVSGQRRRWVSLRTRHWSGDALWPEGRRSAIGGAARGNRVFPQPVLNVRGRGLELALRSRRGSGEGRAGPTGVETDRAGPTTARSPSHGGGAPTAPGGGRQGHPRRRPPEELRKADGVPKSRPERKGPSGRRCSRKTSRSPRWGPVRGGDRAGPSRCSGKTASRVGALPLCKYGA